jgi:xanthine dehydrogenase YagS FAD-binding subunit
VNRFAFAQPKTFQEAAGLLAEKKWSLPVLKGGGIDLIDRLKEGITEPDLIVNVRRLHTEGAMAPITQNGGKLRIEATATLAEIAASKDIRAIAPVLAMAVEWAASPQVRNVGTAAGNLLQRPRCWYYRHDQFDCLKKGGPTCYAVGGENKYHAIFGDGPCHIVHPSNLAPALMVCDGKVHVIGGDRSEIAIKDLFHLPDAGLKSEHNLKPGEVVTHITCDAAARSGFYAIKEKQSFDWPSVDAALKGVSLDDDAALRTACAKAIEGAKPMTENGYKLKLLPVAIRRAVLAAAGRKTEVDA